MERSGYSQKVALPRDFIADVLRGDGIAAALDLLGYRDNIRTIMRTTGVIPAFIGKLLQEINVGNRVMNDGNLQETGIAVPG
jgi:hypothetical protein